MTFSGLPINGSISYGSEKMAQRTQEEFAAILQPVLDDPTIAWVSWLQYTPYFNDGDPCVFNTHACQMGLKGESDIREADDYDRYDEFPGWADETRRQFGERARSEKSYQRTGKYTGPDEARYDRCDALAKAVMGGEFDDVLLKAFGDHAEVTIIPKVGIDVESWSHD